MGLFRVRGRLTGPTGRSEDVELLVDTGATLLVVTQSLADRLELVVRRSKPALIAGGQRAEGGVWGAEGKRFEDGGAAGEAAVHEDGGRAGDGVHDGRQGVDGALRVVELASAVIRDPDDVDAGLDGALGIARGHDALDADGQARRLLEPRDVIPGQALRIAAVGAARVGRLGHGLARAVAVEDVALAPAVDLHVHGEDDRLVSRGLDAREEVGRPGAVAVMVELEHLGPRARLRDVLHRPSRPAREELERIALRRAARHLAVAFRLEEDEPSHGGDADGP